MPAPDQQWPDALSEKRFDRPVKRLLATSPKPNDATKPAGKRKPSPKRRKRVQKR